MAHIHTLTRHDTLAALLRPEVLAAHGLGRDQARALYPFALASLVVSQLQKDRVNPIVVEIEGPEVFRVRVRGAFAGSHLEDWEIREAYDCICQYLRDPSGGLHFRAASRRRAAQLDRVLTAIGETRPS